MLLEKPHLLSKELLGDPLSMFFNNALRFSLNTLKKHRTHHLCKKYCSMGRRCPHSQIVTGPKSIAIDTWNSFSVFILMTKLHNPPLSLSIRLLLNQTHRALLSVITWVDNPFHSTSSVSRWAVFLGHKR